MNPAETIRRELKIVVIGDAAAGKTAIVHRLVQDEFREGYQATIGMQFCTKNVLIPDYGYVKLNIWDTAGQERFRAITKKFFRGANGALIVYDVSTSRGFTTIDYWKKQLDESEDQGTIQAVVLANKCDLKSDAKLDKEAIKDMGCCGSFLTSAKNNIGISEAVTELILKIIATTPEPTQSVTTQVDISTFVPVGGSCAC